MFRRRADGFLINKVVAFRGETEGGMVRYVYTPLLPQKRVWETYTYIIRHAYAITAGSVNGIPMGEGEGSLRKNNHHPDRFHKGSFLSRCRSDSFIQPRADGGDVDVVPIIGPMSFR